MTSIQLCVITTPNDYYSACFSDNGMQHFTINYTAMGSSFLAFIIFLQTILRELYWIVSTFLKQECWVNVVPTWRGENWIQGGSRLNVNSCFWKYFDKHEICNFKDRVWIFLMHNYIVIKDWKIYIAFDNSRNILILNNMQSDMDHWTKL